MMICKLIQTNGNKVLSSRCRIIFPSFSSLLPANRNVGAFPKESDPMDFARFAGGRKSKPFSTREGWQ